MTLNCEKQYEKKTPEKIITGLMQLQKKMAQMHNHAHCKICSGIQP